MRLVALLLAASSLLLAASDLVAAHDACSDPVAHNYQPSKVGHDPLEDPGIAQLDNRGCNYSCAGLLHYYGRSFNETLSVGECHIRGSPHGWPAPNGGWPQANATVKVLDRRTLIVQGFATSVGDDGGGNPTSLPSRVEAATPNGAVVILRHVTLAGLQSPKDSVGNYGDGGAVSMSAGGGTGGTTACLLTVSHAVFRNNFANDGGAISIAGSVVTLQYSFFVNNSALMGGGAVLVQGAPSASAGTVLQVLNCVFLRNTAQDMGAAIFVKNMQMSGAFDHWLLSGCRGHDNVIAGPAQAGSCGGVVDWEGERFLCLKESDLIVSNTASQPRPPASQFDRWVQVGMNLANGPFDATDCAVNPGQFPWGAAPGECWVGGQAANTSCETEPETAMRICNGVHCTPRCKATASPRDTVSWPAFGQPSATCGVFEDQFGTRFPGVFLWGATCPSARCGAVSTNHTAAAPFSSSTLAVPPICEHGGECWAFRDLGALRYLCSCPAGWWGERCELVDQCMVHPAGEPRCRHGGTCVRVAPDGRGEGAGVTDKWNWVGNAKGHWLWGTAGGKQRGYECECTSNGKGPAYVGAGCDVPLETVMKAAISVGVLTTLPVVACCCVWMRARWFKWRRTVTGEGELLSHAASS